MDDVEAVGTVPSDGVNDEQGMDGDGVLPVFSDGVRDDVGGVEVGPISVHFCPFDWVRLVRSAYMGVMLATTGLLSQVYDPPCDPGIACEGVSDKALETGAILWGLVIGVVVLLILAGVFWDFVSGAWFKRRRQREELWARGFRGLDSDNFRPTVKPEQGWKNGSWVTYVCPTCNQWVYADYTKTVGRKPVELCSKCSPTAPR